VRERCSDACPSPWPACCPTVERLRDGALLVVYYDAARKIIGGTYSRLRDYLEP